MPIRRPVPGESRRVTGSAEESEPVHVRVDAAAAPRPVCVDFHFMSALEEASDLIQNECFRERREMGDDERDLHRIDGSTFIGPLLAGGG